VINIV